jgi:hypothetical protein
MPHGKAVRLELSDSERSELERLLRRDKTAQALTLRAHRSADRRRRGQHRHCRAAGGRPAPGRPMAPALRRVAP